MRQGRRTSYSLHRNDQSTQRFQNAFISLSVTPGSRHRPRVTLANFRCRSRVWDVHIDIGTTVEIDRPAREVWAVLADYGRDPQWRAGVLSMSAEPPGDAAPGTTTAEVMRFAGRTLRNRGEVVRVGPGTELAWRTTSGVDAEGTRVVEPAGPGSCLVRLSTQVRPRGFERVLAPLARLVLQRRIEGDGRRLRSLVQQ